jgi:hypothetical protein
MAALHPFRTRAGTCNAKETSATVSDDEPSSRGKAPSSMSQIETPEPLLITSDRPLTTPYFDGYGFLGAHFIYGATGYNEARTEGLRLSSGEDGCYVLVEERDGILSVGTDHKGYYPIFYYAARGTWAISSSLVHLASYAEHRNWKLTPRAHSLEAWRKQIALLDQLSSFRTIYDEIRVLPSFCNLVVEREQVKVVPRIRTILSSTYKDALETACNLWLGRFRTILTDSRVEFPSIDLSGGLDSRVVLSVALRSCTRLEMSELIASRRLNVRSRAASEADFAAAQQISERYGLALNSADRSELSREYSSEESFDRWRVQNLGRYGLIIFPMRPQDLSSASVPGVGGEGHRLFYGKFDHGLLGKYLGPIRRCLRIDNFSPYLKYHEKFFRSPHLHRAWHEDVTEALDLVRSNYDVSIPVSIMHYREFRDRCHTSKLPMNFVFCVLLGSKYLAQCSDFAGRSRVHRRQVLFDVMMNMDPELAQLPYDQADKAPTARNVASFTRVSLSPEGGRIFGRSSRPSEHRHVSKRMKFRPDEVLFARAEAALARQPVREIVGDEYRQTAIRKIKKLRAAASRINLHGRGSFLHYILLADFISGSRDQRDKDRLGLSNSAGEPAD